MYVCGSTGRRHELFATIHIHTPRLLLPSSIDTQTLWWWNVCDVINWGLMRAARSTRGPETGLWAWWKSREYFGKRWGWGGGVLWSCCGRGNRVRFSTTDISDASLAHRHRHRESVCVFVLISAGTHAHVPDATRQHNVMYIYVYCSIFAPGCSIEV